ncbi:MAG: glycine-rich domain-containing protein, partial [Kiritimatiellia bacterium]
MTCSVAVTLALLVWTASGQTVYWKGAVSTAWSDPANWTNGTNAAPVKPGPGVSAVVDLRYSPTNLPFLDLANGSVTIASLVVSGGTSAATLTFVNGDVSTKRLVVTGDVTISTNGILTHAAEVSTAATVGSESNRLGLVVGGNLTIAAGGKIDVTGRGYSTGPGAGISDQRGGSHGGEGGWDGASGTQSALTYGSATNPVTSGSASASPGTRGGGTVKLAIEGTLNLNGSIDASGVGGYGGSAGGSVNITAAKLTGSGAVYAIGGDDTPVGQNGGGGGGGGRIAIVLNGSGDDAKYAKFAGLTILACGGAQKPGGAGTVYLKGNDTPYGCLIVDNNNRPTAVITPLKETLLVDRIEAKRYGLPKFGAGCTLDLRQNCVLISDGTSRFIWETGAIQWPASYTLGGASTPVTLSRSGTRELTINCANLTIATNAVLTHEGVTSTEGNPEDNMLNARIQGSLTIDSGGTISVLQKGYSSGHGPASSGGEAYGPGHGGQGGAHVGQTPKDTYGSATDPVRSGSGGGAPGGGAVKLTITGDLIVNGSIVSDGVSSYIGSAGGSVNITVGKLTGIGTVSASGGGSYGNGNPGGGGRVAIVLTNAADTAFVPWLSSSRIQAYGGAHATVATCGAAGTVYLKGTNTLYGRLIVDNNNISSTTPSRTHMSAAVGDVTVGDVILRNEGRMSFGAGTRKLIVYGNWSNGVSGAADSAAGAVTLGGGAPATVWGANNWQSLLITNAGKGVSFESGATQTISTAGALILTGAEGKLVTLKSVTPGTRWKLNAGLGSTHDVRYVQVADAEAVALDPILALDSEGASANNDNWAFGAATNVWTGSQNGAWEGRQNWSLGRLPTEIDWVVIAAGPNNPALDTDRGLRDLSVDKGAVLNLNNRKLSVWGDLRNAGKITGQGVLRLSGTTAQNVTASGNAFNNLEIATTGLVAFADSFSAAKFTCRVAGADLVFNAGSVVTFGGLDLRGAPGKPIKIRSSASSQAVKWNLTGVAVVSQVDVSAIDAAGGNRICAVDATGNGHTPNWDFAPKHCRGGVETEKFIGDLKYRIHTFVNSATLAVSRPVEIEYLIVAGGGGGGYLHQGGGGGAGGFLEGKGRVTNGVLSVVVGAGGKAGLNGGNSSIAGVGVAIGGGQGGTEHRPPNEGGSGGGGCHGPGLAGAAG